MYPSETQLLKQLRKGAAQLQRESGSPEHQALLGAMDVLLNELLLRRDKTFYLEHYRRGRELLADGLVANGADNPSLEAGFHALPEAVNATTDMDTIADAGLKLAALLEAFVETADVSSGDKLAALLARMADWDAELMRYRLQRIPMDESSLSGQSVNIDKAALQDYLRRKKPEWKNIEVTHFHRVAGGFSKCTILFETHDVVNGRQAMAMRAEQPIHLLDLDGSDIANEYPLVRKAFESGIPVAEPLWLETDTSLLGTRFFVSRKAAGANFGTAKGAETKLPAAVVKDLATVMANIHNIPLDRHASWINESHFGKWLDFGSARQNTLARLAEWRAQGKAARIFPSPHIARALRWLEANVPDDDGEPVFLHGDFGPHNILLDGNRVGAVLDWEISTPGDPAYDVCWFLNCTAGAVDRNEFLDHYRAAGGKPISEYSLRYFEVFACMFMPVTCNASLRLIEDNDAANINLAVYGLQFAYEYARRLQGAIERAEAVRASGS